MHTAVVLFTRDLRLHDHPALATAVAHAERVVPIFVLDEAIIRSRYAAPNRAHMLAACLRDLDEGLRERGGALVVRRGDVAAEVAKLADATQAEAVYLGRDVSGYAQRRERRLADAVGNRLRPIDGVVTAVPPGHVTPSGGDYFKVFTPYHRAWQQALGRRGLAPAPHHVQLPDGVELRPLPEPSEIASGATSPELRVGGERSARADAAAWYAGPVADYDDTHDALADDATSRLSAYLHFGALSAYELVTRADHRRRGVAAFTRQLAWRDFYAQVLAARPEVTRQDFRQRPAAWRDDDDAFAAWQRGTTGVPLVDAGMRQLAREGWMHNRARLVTASFLTKHLQIDWRRGAQHFSDLLVDGDVASNTMNWQWVAGTGTDTRPGRILNPTRQAQRHDPKGDYIRRYVDELADRAVPEIFEPWKSPAPPRGYASPIVDLAAAARSFRAGRI